MASSTKQRTNVSIDADLLQAARFHRINVSAAVERALREEVTRRREQAWLQENKGAIEDANKFIEKFGLWSDGLRMF